MAKTDMVKSLAEWIKSLIEDVKKDTQLSIAWFDATKDAPLSIIGGWMEGFSDDYASFLCTSKSNPGYAMCVKIAINEGPYAYTDFEIMNMPYDKVTGEVDDTCIALEYDDDPIAIAQFFVTEWERLMTEYTKEAI